MYEDFIDLIHSFKVYLSENSNFSQKKAKIAQPASPTPQISKKPSALSSQDKATSPIVNTTTLEVSALQPVKAPTPIAIKPFESRPTAKVSISLQETSSTASFFSHFHLEPPLPKQIVLDEMRELISSISPNLKCKKGITLYHAETSAESIQFLNDIAKAIMTNFARHVYLSHANEKLTRATALVIAPLNLAQIVGLSGELQVHSIYTLSSNQSFLTIYSPSHYFNNHPLKKGLWEMLKKVIPQLP